MFSDWIEQLCMMMETEGTRQRGDREKTWWDCVKEGVKKEFWRAAWYAGNKDERRLRVKSQQANRGLEYGH